MSRQTNRAVAYSTNPIQNLRLVSIGILTLKIRCSNTSLAQAWGKFERLPSPTDMKTFEVGWSLPYRCHLPVLAVQKFYRDWQKVTLQRVSFFRRRIISPVSNVRRTWGEAPRKMLPMTGYRERELGEEPNIQREPEIMDSRTMIPFQCIAK